MNGDGQSRDTAGESSGDSHISRRTLIAGGLLTVGGSARLLDSTTVARFRDTETASGTIRVGQTPTLDYRIYDQTKNNNAEFKVAYQVENVDPFDRIEITVDNVPDGQYNPNPGGDAETESFSRTSPEGTVSTSSYGGHSGDTFEFIFTVFEQGTASPVIEKTVTDTADGNDTGDGNFGNKNSAEIEWILVEDDTKSNNGNYTVYYELTNLDNNVGLVRGRFQNGNNSWATVSDTSTDTPNGTLSYNEGGTGGDPFDIVVEVENENGLIVDEVTISDVADGNDPAGYGDPGRPDSPTLDSFTLTDTTQNNNTNYSLSYQTSNTARFGGARVRFENTQKASATETKTTGDTKTSGTVTYSAGGTEGDLYEITVIVLENRNGITFPIDSGTLEDVADGGSSKSWP